MTAKTATGSDAAVAATCQEPRRLVSLPSEPDAVAGAGRNSGLWQLLTRADAASWVYEGWTFDHLVGAVKQRGRGSEAERLGSLQMLWGRVATAEQRRHFATKEHAHGPKC